MFGLGKKKPAPKPAAKKPSAPVKPPPPKPPVDPWGLPAFLAAMRQGDRTPLGDAHFEASAQRLGLTKEVIRAVVQVECSGKSGFCPTDGLPMILYEPHVFSRLTQKRFDATHPDVSYPNMDPKKYPPAQEGRWKQMAKAFALDPEAALQSASWGAFQILGINYETCGFRNAASFASYVAGSEARQLEAFEAFITAHKLIPLLKAKNWKGFAKVYNGPRYAESYGKKLAAAYKAG